MHVPPDINSLTWTAKLSLLHFTK